MARSALRTFVISLAGALALGATGCVETSVYEKAARDLERAQRAATEKDEQIHVLQWQLAQLGQKVYEAQQINQAYQGQLQAQIQKLTAQNAELAERLSKEERAHAALLATAVADGGAPPGRPGARGDDVRRLLAAVEARNAQLAEQLGRIERQLAGHLVGIRGEAPASPRPSGGGTDVVDPWGFGSRK